MDKTSRCKHQRYSVPVPLTAADSQCVRRPDHQGVHRAANGDTWDDWTTCGAIDPTAPIDSFRHSPCQRNPHHAGEHIAQSCHRWDEQSTPREMGTDPASGKRILVVAEPGGSLEAMADRTALETAAVLSALVGEVLAAGQASDTELGAFVPALVASLTEVTEVAARRIDRVDVKEPLFGSAARALGEALRQSQQQ